MIIDVLDNNNYLTRQIISRIKKIARQCLKHLKSSPETELCISIIDDESMRNLYEIYKGRRRTTDVLSFPQSGNLLGDIVISYETAKRNSSAYNTGINDELARLVIHGILHLTGFDHKKPGERKIMREKEAELEKTLKELGVKF